jgi:glycosyltransferase involved in cell wall biosynthesis
LNKDDCFDISKVLFFKLKRKKIHILGGIGVCLNMFRFKKPVVNQVRFIFIGRLLKEKGIFEFLDSAKKLKAKYKDKVKFIVLGGLDKDNPGSVSKDVLTKYMDDGIVEYPGLVENVKEWIEDSSIFVLPSYREGFPRSTQEAMAIGRAVITTDTPGCRDTVVEGQNGFLVEPNNVMALIEKMEFFIENPEQIEKMGKKSREIAENDFNIDLKDRQLIDLILSIR